MSILRWADPCCVLVAVPGVANSALRLPARACWFLSGFLPRGSLSYERSVSMRPASVHFELATGECENAISIAACYHGHAMLDDRKRPGRQIIDYPKQYGDGIHPGLPRGEAAPDNFLGWLSIGIHQASKQVSYESVGNKLSSGDESFPLPLLTAKSLPTLPLACHALVPQTHSSQLIYHSFTRLTLSRSLSPLHLFLYYLSLSPSFKSSSKPLTRSRLGECIVSRFFGCAFGGVEVVDLGFTTLVYPIC
jgi:hypothetical protein